MKEKKHDLTTPEGRLANMLDFHTTERGKALEAGLWYEVRYWAELSEGHFGTPSHWAPICWATSRSSASLVAEALYRARGWWCEVWTCSPVVDPDTYTGDGRPVHWHLCDTEPPYFRPEARRGAPPSGNPGEQSSRWKE